MNQDQMREALQQLHDEAKQCIKNREAISPFYILKITMRALHDEPAKPEPSEDAKRTLANPPDRIYLQVGDADSDFPGEIHWRDVTWSDEQVERSDLVYVRQTAPMVSVFDEVVSPAIIACIGTLGDELTVRRVWDEVRRAMIAKNGGK